MVPTLIQFLGKTSRSSKSDWFETLDKIFRRGLENNTVLQQILVVYSEHRYMHADFFYIHNSLSVTSPFRICSAIDNVYLELSLTDPV